MDLNYLRKLLKIFDESTASEISIEEEGTKLKFSKASKEKSSIQYIAQPHHLQHNYQMPAYSEQTKQESAPIVQQESKSAPQVQIQPTIVSGHKIYSPIVGTFYRSSSPDAPPYVEIGSRVNKGTVLCIIEAMKLMNEIESDIAGIITAIYANNAEPVEYNQPLFEIKPD